MVKNYCMKDIAEEMRELFPEMTVDGSNLVVSEVLACVSRAIERGQPVKLPGLMTVDYPVRTRVAGYLGGRNNEPRPVKVLKFKPAGALRLAISQLPVSEEELQEWQQKREYNRNRTQSFMYKGD